MSEHFDSENKEELDGDQIEAGLEDDDLEQDEYEEYDEEEEIDEEISTAEVDRVLETLTKMMEEVESDSVHSYLEEAYHGVFQLVYEEEASDEEGEEGVDSHSEAA